MAHKETINVHGIPTEVWAFDRSIQEIEALLEGKNLVISGVYDNLEAIKAEFPEGADGYYQAADTKDIYTYNKKTGKWDNLGPLQGPAGPEGPEGKQGEPGPTGPAGPAGDTGPMGPEGPASTIPGPKGDTGKQGPVYIPTVSEEGELSWALSDDPGETPQPVNIKGEKGEDSTVPGPQGAKGDTGPVFVPSVDPDSGELSWTKQDSAEDTPDPVIIKGPQGERGPAGPAGPAGTGTGDMLASVYDKHSKQKDIFDYVDNAVSNVQPKLTIDDEVTQDSENPVKSSGVYTALEGKADKTALDGKQDKLTGQKGQIVGFNEDGNAVAQDGGGGSLAPSSLKIATPPKKTDYTEGDEFDPSGMTVEVYCEDGTHYATNEYTIDPTGPLADGMEHVTVKYNYGQKNLTVEQEISVTKGIQVFGVVWDMDNQSTALERLTVSSDPKKLVTTDIQGDPSPAVGQVGGSSPFDTYLPWSGMEEYNISGDQITKTGNDSFSRSNDTLVYIPEFGYKAVAEGNKIYYYISSKPTQDCPKHPGSGKYIAKYTTGAENVCKTGTAPLVNQTRDQFRQGAKNKGAHWQQWGFDAWCAVLALYLVEWADWDSQTKIGRGYVDRNSSALPSGATDTMNYHTGRAEGENGKTAVMYRWIENPWGNVRQFVDGYNTNGLVTYFCTDPEKYADETDTGYTPLGINLPSSGYVKELGISDAADWAFCPKTGGGSDSTYIPDYTYSNSSGWRVLSVGGDWINSSYAGLCYFSANYTAAYTSSGLGSRLLYNP